jgi:hypothetical protein
VLDSKKSLLNHNTPSNTGIVVLVWTYFMAKGLNHTFHLSLNKRLSLSLLKIVTIVNIFDFIVYTIAIMFLSCVQPKRKNLINKNQGWEPIHEKYKANENTSRCNPKEKKTKQSTKKGKDLMQRGFMAMK